MNRQLHQSPFVFLIENKNYHLKIFKEVKKSKTKKKYDIKEVVDITNHDRLSRKYPKLKFRKIYSVPYNLTRSQSMIYFSKYKNKQKNTIQHK